MRFFIIFLLCMGMAYAGVDQNDFQTSVCYEGDIGDYATHARLGYKAENMGWGVVERNEVSQANENAMLPQGLPLGLDSYGWVWSSNAYELNDRHYLWKLKIDGKSKNVVMFKKGMKATIVTPDNQCPQPIPEFGTAAAIIALAGGALILYRRK